MTVTGDQKINLNHTHKQFEYARIHQGLHHWTLKNFPFLVEIQSPLGSEDLGPDMLICALYRPSADRTDGQTDWCFYGCPSKGLYGAENALFLSLTRPN
jgi:hypothetical protein